MQVQEIITESDNDYLVIALPTLIELFEYGCVSRSGKSFSFRTWNHSKTVLNTYRHVKFNPDLIKDRIVNSKKMFHKSDIIIHDFNNIGLPAAKISLSKKTYQYVKQRTSFG